MNAKISSTIKYIKFDKSTIYLHNHRIPTTEKKPTKKKTSEIGKQDLGSYDPKEKCITGKNGVHSRETQTYLQIKIIG